MSANYGLQQPSDAAGEYNQLVFVVQQLIAQIRTMNLVTVLACTSSGGVAIAGTVTVQILVNQMTGNRVAIPHGAIYNVPYLRIQGGANAVIMDPQVGDIGLCGFCDRDISAVKSTQGAANPGSYRMFDYADGLYLGGFLNGVPTQYVQFLSSGVNVVSPQAITLTAPNITVAASSQFTITSPTTSASGAITAADDVKAGNISLQNHVHTGVSTGSSNTGGPTG